MDFALIGVPLDKSQTLRKGAAKAPAILRKVFPKLETFIFGVDLADSAFINDLGNTYGRSTAEAEPEIKEMLSKAQKRAFPIFLGGDHSITFAAASAVRPDKVVVFDAHADCENSDGHDGVVRRLVEKFGAKNVYLFGTRVASKAEDRFIKENKVQITDLNGLAKLKGNVYLSIDYDVLDPSIIPSVGNPEPMGKTFGEVSEAIGALADRLVAADFVEFTPIKTDEMGIHALIAGKLIYDAMARVIRAKE
ncbi:MAG: arginase family protein [Candidatus Aenigmatarchaeota archaeon]